MHGIGELTMTNYERIQNMTIAELAKFFITNTYPDFPNSPCYICEHDRGTFCSKPSRCTDEDKALMYQWWLESKYEKEDKKVHCVDLGGSSND
jgi:hypothetical protein